MNRTTRAFKPGKFVASDFSVKSGKVGELLAFSLCLVDGGEVEKRITIVRKITNITKVS